MKALLLLIACIGIAYGQQDPLCLVTRFQQDSSLIDCDNTLASNPANLCNLPCVQDFEDVFTECGITPNPVTVVCPNLNGGTDNGNETVQDPSMCLGARIVQDNTLIQCVTEFSGSNPADVCSLSCVQALADAYTDCGFTPNPITQVCPNINGSSNETVPNPSMCLAARIVQDNTLIQCVTEFSGANPADVCSLSCVQALANAYTDCGFTPNPITQVCSNLNLNVSTGNNGTGLPDITCVLDSFRQNASLLECDNTLLGFSPTSVCSLPCVEDLEQVYTDCGFTETSNPVTTVCSVLEGSGSGPLTPFVIPTNALLQGILPLCAATELQSELQSISPEVLRNCSTLLITGNTQALCESTCFESVVSAYGRCGYTEAFNPAILLCEDAENRTTFSQLACLGREFQSLTFSDIQPCTSAITFIGDEAACQSPCAERLRVAYSTCGFEGERNPVGQFCSMLPVVIIPTVTGNATCLSSSLQTANLQTCLTALTINPIGICATDCVDNLSAAYSGCGFTGVNNPVDLVCGYVQNATEGLDNPLQTCITRVQQAVQRCISNTIISRNFNLQECASDIQEAFGVCGFDEQIFNLTGLVCTIGGDIKFPLPTDGTPTGTPMSTGTTTEPTDQESGSGPLEPTDQSNSSTTVDQSESTSTTEAINQSNTGTEITTEEGETEETRGTSNGAPVVTSVSMVIMTSVMLVFNTAL